MDRETFKLLAAGRYSYGKPSVKHEDMQTFIDGALFAFDYIEKQKTKEKLSNDEPIVVQGSSLMTGQGNFSKTPIAFTISDKIEN